MAEKEVEEGALVAAPESLVPPASERDGSVPYGRPSRWGVRGAMADRVAVYVVRALFFLIAVGLGAQGARALSELTAPFEIPAFSGMIVACVVAFLLILLEALFARSPIRTISAISFGLLIGLVLSLVFSPVVELITKSVAPGINKDQLGILLPFLNLLTTSVFCYFGVTLLLATKDDFKFIIPFVEFRKEVKDQMPLVLDTSVFIDGRIQSLLAIGLLEQRLLVPRFVLDELQGFADLADRSMRERGRRGMDVLHDVRMHHSLEIIDFPLEKSRDEDVDSGLLRLTHLREGKLVTTDHNLTKRARLQGVSVLNINEVASSMKPRAVPGQMLEVNLLRAGEESGQAVGFLNDGTMVVVEGAADRIGQDVRVVVTSSLQTSAGKMIFGKPARGARRKS